MSKRAKVDFDLPSLSESENETSESYSSEGISEFYSKSRRDNREEKHSESDKEIPDVREDEYSSDISSASELEEKEEPFVDYKTEIDLRLILGPPKSGKSHLGRNIITTGVQNDKWDIVLILAPSADSGDYDYIDPKLRCSNGLKFVLKARNLIRIQKANLANAKKTNTRMPRALLVLDDPLGTVKWEDPFWTFVCSSYRQFFTDVMIMSQYVPRIPLAYYTFATKICVFRQKQEHDYKCIWQRFLSSFVQQTGWRNFKQAQQNFQNLKENNFYFFDLDPKAEIPVLICEADPLSKFEHIKVVV